MIIKTSQCVRECVREISYYKTGLILSYTQRCDITSGAQEFLQTRDENRLWYFSVSLPPSGKISLSLSLPFSLSVSYTHFKMSNLVLNSSPAFFLCSSFHNSTKVPTFQCLTKPHYSPHLSAPSPCPSLFLSLCKCSRSSCSPGR